MNDEEDDNGSAWKSHRIITSNTDLSSASVSDKPRTAIAIERLEGELLSIVEETRDSNLLGTKQKSE